MIPGSTSGSLDGPLSEITSLKVSDWTHSFTTALSDSFEYIGAI